MNQVEMKSTLELLGSIATTSKYGMTLRTLARDYRELVGEDIPFNKFGFKSLPVFLLSATDTFTFEYRDSELVIKARSNSDTAHIQALVSKQRTKKPNGLNMRQRLFNQSYSPVGNNSRGNFAPRINYNLTKPVTSWPSHAQNRGLSSSLRPYQPPPNFASATGTKMTRPISNLSSEAILKRVAELIKNIKQGIPEKRVEFEYQERYKECLANGWRMKLEDYQKLSGARKFVSFESLPGIWVLKPSEECQKHTTYTGKPSEESNLITSKEIEKSINANGFQRPHGNGQDLNQMINSMSRVALDKPASFGSEAIPSKIEEMKCMESTSADVLVTSVQGPDLFWMRLYSDKMQYEELASKMISFYTQNRAEFPMSSMETNDFMAGKIGNLWFRVKLLSKNLSGNFVAQAVDTGKLVQIKPSDLQQLHPMFKNVQPFAMKAKISGSTSTSWTREILDDFEARLLGKMFICTLLCVKKGCDLSVTNVVRLTDTRGETDFDATEDLGI